MTTTRLLGINGRGAQEIAVEEFEEVEKTDLSSAQAG